MKAFQILGDEKRIYFRNYERRPGEEELSEAMKILRKAGGEIGKKVEAADVDYYKGTLGGLPFTLIFTGEEAVICMENKEGAEKMIKVFE